MCFFNNFQLNLARVNSPRQAPCCTTHVAQPPWPRHFFRLNFPDINASKVTFLWAHRCLPSSTMSTKDWQGQMETKWENISERLRDKSDGGRCGGMPAHHHERISYCLSWVTWALIFLLLLGAYRGTQAHRLRRSLQQTSPPLPTPPPSILYAKGCFACARELIPLGASLSQEHIEIWWIKNWGVFCTVSQHSPVGLSWSCPQWSLAWLTLPSMAAFPFLSHSLSSVF